MEHEAIDQFSGAQVNRVANVGAVNVRIDELNAATTHIKTARYVTYGVGALTVGVTLVGYLSDAQEFLDLGANIGMVIEGLIYIACGAFTARKPLLCLGVALGLYVLDLVFLALESGAEGFAQGYILKGLVLFGFGRGVWAAWKRRGLLDGLREVGVAEGHLAPTRRLEAVPAVERPAGA